MAVGCIEVERTRDIVEIGKREVLRQQINFCIKNRVKFSCIVWMPQTQGHDLFLLTHLHREFGKRATWSLLTG